MSQYLNYQEQKISVGDTIAVSQEIAEGEKKRTQVFEGILMAVSGSGAGQAITVRKISAHNVAVEKIFPIQLPSIKKIEVKRRGSVRRSKLYYLRDKIGKSATKIKEASVAQRQKINA
ncbi:MAG: 50S ribosomal protein L19 [bacterium]|nr:50S ribosomal protein L19 [bacterium]